MAEIRVKDNESLDSALRRFKRSCAKAGVLSEVRKREHYEKPSVKRKKKSEAARKRKFRQFLQFILSRRQVLMAALFLDNAVKAYIKSDLKKA